MNTTPTTLSTTTTLTVLVAGAASVWHVIGTVAAWQ